MNKIKHENEIHEDTREEMLKKEKEIKEAYKELDRFNKKAYNYIQARKLMKQAEYYKNWDQIFETETVNA